jgi:hypothetical protein
VALPRGLRLAGVGPGRGVFVPAGPTRLIGEPPSAQKGLCQDVVMTDPGSVEGEPTPQQFELVWPDDVGAEAQPVNKAMFAWDEDNRDVVYMYLAHLPPVPWATPEIADRRAKEIENKLPVASKGSFILSRKRAEELWETLGNHLGKHVPNAND